MAWLDEHKLAKTALARLRAENRRNSGRPYRAASLAEAEAMVVMSDDNRTPVGICARTH